MNRDENIYTGHLCTLRPWRPEDAEALARQANDIRIWDHMRDFFPHPYTRADADAFIALVSGKSPVQDFAIVADGRVAGGIGYTPGSDVERVSAEMGYWLGEGYRGRGIMSEAAGALAEHIFSTTGVQRIFATVFDFNAASMRVLEKAGFRKVGVLRKAAIKNGRVIDLHYYERIRM